MAAEATPALRQAAAELLKQLPPAGAHTRRVADLLRLVAAKQSDQRLKGSVLLELAEHLLQQGDHRAAYETIRPLVDAPPLRDDARALCACGLAQFHEWLRVVREEVAGQAPFLQRRHQGCDVGEEDAAAMATVRRGQSHDAKADDLEEEARMWDRAAAHVGELGGQGVPIKKEEAVSTRSAALVLLSQLRRGAGRRSAAGDEGAYKGDSGDEEAEDGRREGGDGVDLALQECDVIAKDGMSAELFPLDVPLASAGQPYRLEHSSRKAAELSREASEYLARSLELDPKHVPSVLPLLQLLLASGRVKDALILLNYTSSMSSSPEPLRLKALLLSCVEPLRVRALLECCLALCQRDPASLLAVNFIVELNDQGLCGEHLLMRVLALHLDYSSGTDRAWEKLASTFDSIRGKAFGRRRYGVQWGASEVKPEGHNASRQLLKELWVSTRRWWELRHFGVHELSGAGLADGFRWRYADKGACAAHILGAENAYTAKCKEVLRHNPQALSDLLQRCSACWPPLPLESQEGSWHVLTRGRTSTIYIP
eukprot:SM000052S17721  [mRNA]  locus=s52:328152:331137:+ [translate_table: standard]